MTAISVGATKAPPVIEAANWFARQGFHVFPVWSPKGSVCSCPKGKDCTSPAKHPATKTGFKQATRDQSQIAKFLSNPKTSNYGLVPPAGIWAIDVDKDGLARWEEIEHLTGNFPTTLTTKTPHGMHIFVHGSPDQLPDGQVAGYVVRRGAEDPANADGYVIGPGSKNIEGKVYDLDRSTVERGRPIFARIPQPWIDRLKPVASSSSSTETKYKVPTTSVPEGGRYETIRNYQASRYNTGMSGEEILAAAHAALLDTGVVTGLTVEKFDERFWRAWSTAEESLGEPAGDVFKIVGMKKAKHHLKERVVTEADASLIVNIADYLALIPETIPWIAEPYVYAGGVTLLSGPPKGGKSTLMANLQAAREIEGSEFLGAPVPLGPTLLVTEEGGVAVRWKTEGLVALDVLDRRSAAGMSFENVLELISLWAAAQSSTSPCLVFIDTLAIWAGVEDENAASIMTQAIAPIMQLAQKTGAGVVIVHHARKGGGRDGEAIRGSGAIYATVDLAMELSRIGDEEDGLTDRRLDVSGRVVMPHSLTLGFDPLTKHYRVVESVESAKIASDKALGWMPNEGDSVWVTKAEIAARLKVKDPIRWLEKWADHLEIKEEGRGGKRFYQRRRASVEGLVGTRYLEIDTHVSGGSSPEWESKSDTIGLAEASKFPPDDTIKSGTDSVLDTPSGGVSNSSPAVTATKGDISNVGVSRSKSEQLAAIFAEKDKDEE